jgi:UDPglucose 6-dehydrogenase
MALKIAIIGVGHVGRTMADLFTPKSDVVTYDAGWHEPYPLAQISQCDVALICVDTPGAEDGSCDISNVKDAVSSLPISNVLIRSTVAPGTTDELIKLTGKNICFWPEYLGESTYYHEFWSAGAASMPFNIFGGEQAITSQFIDMLIPILGPTRKYFQCSAVEAEIIKYMENSYLGLKVTFVNEFAKICSAFGADWNTVREGWLLDPRIEPSHTAVFRQDPGFGGKCLPKDIRAIVAASMQAGYDPSLLAEVLSSNERFRRGIRADGGQSSGDHQSGA